MVPSSVEMLCLFCFSHCYSFSSISFESHSWLKRIGSHVSDRLWSAIAISCTVLLVAPDLGFSPHHFCL
jgi:hypothetical protein